MDLNNSRRMVAPLKAVREADLYFKKYKIMNKRMDSLLKNQKVIKSMHVSPTNYNIN